MEGYHFGILSCAVVAAMVLPSWVLLINLCFTIWAVLRFRTQSGLGTLYDGSCKRTRTLAFWIHLAINVFSTLLLGASNYSMQCLSAPTRGEIDKAHSQGIWLDIGVPSVRNLLLEYDAPPPQHTNNTCLVMALAEVFGYLSSSSHIDIQLILHS